MALRAGSVGPGLEAGRGAPARAGRAGVGSAEVGRCASGSWAAVPSPAPARGVSRRPPRRAAVLPGPALPFAPEARPRPRRLPRSRGGRAAGDPRGRAEGAAGEAGRLRGGAGGAAGPAGPVGDRGPRPPARRLPSLRRRASPDRRGARLVDSPGCAAASLRSLRPAPNSRLRTGTDQGNPTV